MGNIKFIVYPEATIYEQDPEQTGKKSVAKKALWGDWVEVL